MTRDQTGPATESQQTIASKFGLSGHGLHSGNPARAVVKPGNVDTGIIFRRVDLPGEPSIPADVRLVSGVDWQTVIGQGDCVVRTVEHLLAAVAAHKLDNLEIQLDGAEPPALDGSATGWCEAIREAGSKAQKGVAPRLAITEVLTVEEGASRYVVTPADEYRISARIAFDHPAIGDQGRELQTLRLAVSDLQSIRNSLAHAAANVPRMDTVKPAYSLDEWDDDG